MELLAPTHEEQRFKETKGGDLRDGGKRKNVKTELTSIF